MIDLVAKGEIAPSAARVAEIAGVGLRSVFRHFDDMDALYREIAEHVERLVLPILLQPLKAEHWRERIRELVDRRARIFETIMPFRIASDIKRFQFPFLMESHERMLRMERGSIEVVLPPTLLADREAVDMLLVAMSFLSWRLLRHDQNLSVTQAHGVMLRMVNALLAQMPCEPPV